LGERLDRRESPDESSVERFHPGSLRLLKHHLGDQDPVRIARLSPGERTCVAAIPSEQRASETREGRGEQIDRHVVTVLRAIDGRRPACSTDVGLAGRFSIDDFRGPCFAGRRHVSRIFVIPNEPLRQCPLQQGSIRNLALSRALVQEPDSESSFPRRTKAERRPA
jgi:hypothetical protein